jgi:hypothetical protein
MTYIYERNPDTGEVFRREFGNYNKRKLINKTENMEMISLYDYLGRAAGPDLGKTVATAAAKAGIKSEIREVNHRGWNGPIMLYPRDFLDNFFGGGLGEGRGPGKQLLKG